MYCSLVCCYHKDMLHKLPALSGLKGNFDCIFKEILSRRSELQIHHHCQIPYFLPSIFQLSIFISVWERCLALDGLISFCSHVFSES